MLSGARCSRPQAGQQDAHIRGAEMESVSSALTSVSVAGGSGGCHRPVSQLPPKPPHPMGRQLPACCKPQTRVARLERKRCRRTIFTSVSSAPRACLGGFVRNRCAREMCKDAAGGPERRGVGGGETAACESLSAPAGNPSS